MTYMQHTIMSPPLVLIVLRSNNCVYSVNHYYFILFYSKPTTRYNEVTKKVLSLLLKRPVQSLSISFI